MKIEAAIHVLKSEWKRMARGRGYLLQRLFQGVRVDSPPVFIVGCGHSGTTLLLAVLGAHSRIYAVPEETFVAYSAGRRRFRRWLRRFDRWTVAAGKRRWVEKSPKHIHRVRQILGWCPQARVLLMVRDGRDVTASIKARKGTAEEGISRWVEDNLAGKAYWDHPNVLVVKYEELVADFRGTCGKILGFIGEDYEEGMRDYHATPKKWYSEKIAKPSTAFGDNHDQHRNWQINQPIFDGRGRWKELSEEELATVNRVGGSLLAELGYAAESGSVPLKR
jgi:hypothetical protein